MNDDVNIASVGPISWDAITARTKVYVAGTRMEQSADQAEALQALQEITSSLLGAGQMALYQLDATGQSLSLCWSFGLDTDKYSMLEVSEHRRLAEALTGKVILRDVSSSDQYLLSKDDSVNGIMPIRVNGAVVGVLIIFRVLPHKGKFDSQDLEICKALSDCAGRAIQPRRERETFVPAGDRT